MQFFQELITLFALGLANAFGWMLLLPKFVCCSKRRNFEPECVLVTGAASGVGAALAKGFAKKGVRVVLLDLAEDRLAETAAAVKAAGGEAVCRGCDATDREAMKELLEGLDDEKAIDLVLPCAGISETISRAQDLGTAFHRVTNVNLIGVYNTIFPLIDRMAGRGRGQIGIIGSLSSLSPLPFSPAYATTKAALRHMAQALRARLACANVLVTVISPGYIDTPMIRREEETKGIKLPFVVSTDFAAQRIKKGLADNDAEIAFAWQPHLLSLFFNSMPRNTLDWLAQNRLLMRFVNYIKSPSEFGAMGPHSVPPAGGDKKVD